MGHAYIFFAKTHTGKHDLGLLSKGWFKWVEVTFVQLEAQSKLRRGIAFLVNRLLVATYRAWARVIHVAHELRRKLLPFANRIRDKLRFFTWEAWRLFIHLVHEDRRKGARAVGYWSKGVGHMPLATDEALCCSAQHRGVW